MSSMNKVFILGHLGVDPEIRYTPEGSAVANMNIATSSYSTKSGEKKEYTEWHRCVAFNKAAEFAEQYLVKGSQVLVEGSLRTRKWQDKTGADRYTTEIVVGRLTAVGDKKRNREGQSGTQAEPVESTAPGFDGLDDDIPF